MYPPPPSPTPIHCLSADHSLTWVRCWPFRITPPSLEKAKFPTGTSSEYIRHHSLAAGEPWHVRDQRACPPRPQAHPLTHSPHALPAWPGLACAFFPTPRVENQGKVPQMRLCVSLSNGLGRTLVVSLRDLLSILFPVSPSWLFYRFLHQSKRRNCRFPKALTPPLRCVYQDPRPPQTHPTNPRPGLFHYNIADLTRLTLVASSLRLGPTLVSSPYLSLFLPINILLVPRLGILLSIRHSK